MNGEWDECRACNGTGIDHADWTGRCTFCAGTGEVWIELGERTDEDDDDHGR